MKLNRVLTHGLPSSSWGYPREERGGCILFDGNRNHPCDPYL